MAYPIAAFHFKVSWEDGPDMGFSEVSGLSVETQPIEYRDGMMKGSMLPLKRPGLKKSGNVTLKRGMVSGNNDLYYWFTNFGDPNVTRKSLIVTLLNDEGEPVFVWKILQAWPIKVEGPSLKATGNEIAIESIELAHEGITVDKV